MRVFVIAQSCDCVGQAHQGERSKCHGCITIEFVRLQPQVWPIAACGGDALRWGRQRRHQCEASGVSDSGDQVEDGWLCLVWLSAAVWLESCLRSVGYLS